MIGGETGAAVPGYGGRLVARVSWARTASPVTLPPRNSDVSGLSVRALRP